MTFQERGQIIRRALVHFSTAHQVAKAVEELGELVTAIARMQQGQWTQEKQDNLIEEIADARIMLDQLALIYGAVEVQKKEQEKLSRLENLMA